MDSVNIFAFELAASISKSSENKNFTIEIIDNQQFLYRLFYGLKHN